VPTQGVDAGSRFADVTRGEREIAQGNDTMAAPPVLGHAEAAASLARGLIAAGPAFGHRLPELFSGEPRRPSSVPVPYPAACRPQAWSAGASLLLLRALLGLEPHVPAGRVVLRPMWPPPFRELEARGVAIGTGRLDIRLHAERGVDVEPHGLDAEVEVVLP
jgi:hypothetical protein